MDYITIGAYIGTGFAVFVTFILFLRGYAPKICVAPLLIIALILCLLLGFSVYQLDADKKNNKIIKTTISANYDDTVNHHNNNEQGFVSDSLKNHKMELNYVVIDIIFGVILTFFVGVGCYKAYYNGTSDHWIPQTIISGLIIISILACIGKNDDTNIDIEKSIKTTVNANYNDVVNFHNDDTNKSFVSDGSKYTFDYDEETKTLTVFTDTNSNVDAVFVNGVKQDNQKTSDKTDKKKDCVSYKTDDADKKPDTTSSSSSTVSSTAVSLQQKIQDKIQSRYSDAVITGFDTIKMSGTFSCDNVQYNFQWKDDMLEVINADDADDVTYYKVVQ